MLSDPKPKRHKLQHGYSLAHTDERIWTYTYLYIRTDITWYVQITVDTIKTITIVLHKDTNDKQINPYTYYDK